MGTGGQGVRKYTEDRRAIDQRLGPGGLGAGGLRGWGQEEWGTRHKKTGDQ
jgi:hypothetical protein